jgi:hypothetical protein
VLEPPTAQGPSHHAQHFDGKGASVAALVSDGAKTRATSDHLTNPSR